MTQYNCFESYRLDLKPVKVHPFEGNPLKIEQELAKAESKIVIKFGQMIYFCSYPLEVDD